MGVIGHHAIIVTGCEDEDCQKAHREAIRIGLRVSPHVYAEFGGYCTFVVSPDGAKEGGSWSAQGDVRRAEFLRQLKRLRDTDPDFACDWVEVQYGNDLGSPRITNHG